MCISNKPRQQPKHDSEQVVITDVTYKLYIIYASAMSWLDTVRKPTYVYERLRVSYMINMQEAYYVYNTM
jgi:hypothetical protein